MAVVSDELCDTDDQPPHQAGVQSDQGRGVDQPEGRDQGLTPQCPSRLSSVTKAGILPGIPSHHCHGDPPSPLILLQAMELLDLGSSGHHKQRDTGTSCGAPAPDSPQTTPTWK